MSFGTYPTPFQTGGIWRSIAVGFWAGMWISMVFSTSSSGWERVVGGLVGLFFAGLVVFRLVGSAFYSRYPIEGLPRILMQTHDVMGTVSLWVFTATLFLVQVAIAAFGGRSIARTKQPGDKTAIDKNGIVYHKNFWTGSWEPEQGLFGPAEDIGLFGPNIKQGTLGPSELRSGFLGAPQHSASGE